ncbi:hypothetical protein BC826DRAFT_965801 [Russula brevipes]|nr:hypothetical protein BC826DRAFT_965801 [Russula brevipes]
MSAPSIAPSNSRGMGWRKPVPKFIPTPPSSRPTSDTSFASAVVASASNENVRPARSTPRTFCHQSASQDFYSDNSRLHRGRGVRVVTPEPRPVFVELSRTMSSTADDRGPGSSRSHNIYRPPTPPNRCSSKPKHAGAADVDGAPFPDDLSRSSSIYCHEVPTTELRHSPPPSICPSESTRMPTTSVKTKPSLQSLASSEDRTAVSSHADIGSWYLADELRTEWNLRLSLDRQNEKTAAPAGVSKEVGGKSELPMHYIPPSRLRKTQKRRSCSDMLWGAMVSAGRSVASLFKTEPVEPGPSTATAK